MPASSRQICHFTSRVAEWVIATSISALLLGAVNNEASAQPAPEPGRTFSLIGENATVKRTAMACPVEADLEAFADAYASAQVAHDDIGKGEAIGGAQEKQCVILHAGETGLVIDSKGFLIGYQRLR